MLTLQVVVDLDVTVHLDLYVSVGLARKGSGFREVRWLVDCGSTRGMLRLARCRVGSDAAGQLCVTRVRLPRATPRHFLTRLAYQALFLPISRVESIPTGVAHSIATSTLLKIIVRIRINQIEPSLLHRRLLTFLPRPHLLADSVASALSRQ